MTTTVEDLGFVEVAGSLEPKALASAIANDAHDRIAEGVTLAFDWLAEDGNELNQMQRVQLLSAILQHVDGLERATLDTLMDAFSRIKRGD